MKDYKNFEYSLTKEILRWLLFDADGKEYAYSRFERWYFEKPTEKVYSGRSKNEKLIAKYLDKIGITYIREYVLYDCKHINSLKFDFALFDVSGNIKCLIEFDGIQHFKPISFFGGEKGLIDLQRRDN